MKHLILVFILVVSKVVSSQNLLKFQIKDTTNQELIENVSIFFNDKLLGISNNYGYLKVNYKCTKTYNTITLNHLSYNTKIVNIKCDSNLIQIVLEPKAVNVGKAFVKKDNFKKEFGSTQIPINYIKKIPYVLGELDALKAVQTLPGVSSGFEANSGIYVRGGNIDQTAIYLDDAPVYNMGHFYGFFSPFDGEALKSFTFYNSGIYSSFGSRGSSVLDVRFREGNLNTHDGSFTLGFLSSKLLAEGPILKNKLSYLGSIRFAYPGFFINSDFKNNFIDGNIKFKFLANKSNTFFLSSFASNDVFSMGDVNGFTVGNSSINKYKWSNKTATLRWNHIAKKGSFANTILSASKFQSRAYFLSDFEPDFGNELLNYSYKTEIDNLKSNLKNFRLGISSNLYISNQGVLYFHRFDTVNYKQNLIPQSKAIEGVLFGEHKYTFEKRNITILSNLRIGYYQNLNDDYNDIIFEPRIKAIKSYNKFKLYAAFDKNSQYQSYVGNRQIAIPSDFWVQASKQHKAQKIHAYSIGFSKDINKFKFTIETYFKNYINALDIKDGAILFRNKNILNDILYVKAIAYGSEFLLEKHFGKFQGHLSYTLSRSIRKSTEINDNAWFAANFDRTHIFNSAINFKPNKKWSFGFLGIFQNGTPVTANYAYTYLYSLRNEYRLPYYYRVDGMVAKNFKFTKKIKGEWNISVFNILFTKNRTAQYPIFDSFSSIPTLPSFTVKLFY